jgi:large repetitive protein
MREKKPRQPLAAMTRFAVGLAALAFGVGAQAFTLNVQDGDGNPVSGFRWVLQQDTTLPVDPTNPPTNPDELLSLSFHASNQPVATSGNSDLGTATIDVPAGRYYISVLPYSGHSIGGKPIDTAVDTTVTVTVQQHPIPTAQIALFLFQDNWPLNGAPDLPEEDNPGADGEAVDWSQFSIKLEEPAGRYGQNGGPVIRDAFDNPLGTTYLADCDPYTPECVDVLGDGTLHPDATTGTLLIKNLAPGKYGVTVDPPPGQNWQQTSTIEGTRVIDAWVKANEPPFFVEFGFPGPHVFMGFVQPTGPLGTVGATLSGTITDMHMSRPPNFQFYSGRAFPQCWVALNEGGPVPGQALYVSPCDADSNFSIEGVPAGAYNLTVFDTNLDVVIATQALTVDAGGTTCNGGLSCDLNTYDDAGNLVSGVAVFNWFSRLNTAVFVDTNHNGFWDANENAAPSDSGPVTLRWRDGTIYQSFPTDTEGFAPFDEVFPFFHWLVAEMGYGRNKITGATFVTDAGGPVDTSIDTFPGFGELTPQPQVCTESQSTDPEDPDFGCVVGTDLINPNTGDNLSRTVLGPVLTQATQGFLGQTSVMQFGIANYLVDSLLPFPPMYVGENGGISGLVLYATTRAEDDPQLAVAETWEPGVPRVQITLYADGDIDCRPTDNFPVDSCDIDWNGDLVRDLNDGEIDDLNKNDLVDLADVDNYPLGNFPGTEDVDHDGDGIFDYGDAIAVTWSDSWDDSLPTGCQGVNNTESSTIVPAVTDDRCFDGLRNFNQVRPGVFDGGWAFSAYTMEALTAANREDLVTKLTDFYTSRITRVGTSTAGVQILPDEWLIPGEYIVAMETPPGYKLLREHHKNVDFGDEYVPSTQAFLADCVGEPALVPPYLALATPDGEGTTLIDGFDPIEYAAPFAGETRPTCNRKVLQLSAGQNFATDFFVMTDVPLAANVSGMILNDLANEFNPNAPAFGEKFAPPFVPVGFYDWNGDEVNRIYADQYGRFNALLPSSFTANLNIPSGFSPNMIVSCMNDAGPIPNPEFETNPDAPELIVDPFFDPRYSQFCYTFQYMPGTITYLDTPVESIAAFANPAEFPVDCERPDATPMISQVTRHSDSGAPGPFVVGGGTVGQAQQVEITSLGGAYTVPNPEWDGVTQSERFITRDYNFGATPGTVQLEDASGTRTTLAINQWQTTRIRASVPATMVPGDYQVIVTRVEGVPEPTESPLGLTLTVGVCQPANTSNAAQCQGTEYGVRPNSDGAPYTASELYAVHRVGPTTAFPTIQSAIDVAAAGDLILVSPGAYDELVVMWKPVKLQGFGAGAVTLNARQSPTEKIANWRTKVEGLVNDGSITQLPGQEAPLPGFTALGAPIFATEEGAGIFVAGRSTGPTRFSAPANRGSRIDGFTIVAASQGGAIVANGYTSDMNIGNNRLTANAGFFGGGIRLGHPTLVAEDPDLGLIYPDSLNDRIRIRHNHITQNGNTFGGAGAGLSIHTGADAYRVQKNWICGNFSQGDGAGIGHLGVSTGGLIEDNLVIFNESFRQAGPVNGAGILIAGGPALQPAPNTGLLLSPGSGNVLIDANIIRGNLAGAGDGGGIRIQLANGMDIDASLNDRALWYDVRVFNNMITNNVAGLAGGGISVQDSVSVSIRQNTIANNDSAATTALAFLPGQPNITVPQPAGVVSRYHSVDMALLMTDVNTDLLTLDDLVFSDPLLLSNIVYENRSFFWLNYDDPTSTTIETGLFPTSCYDTAPVGCDLTDVVAYTNDFGVLNGVVETNDRLDPRVSLLTATDENLANYIGRLLNITGDPDFVNPYYNGSRDALTIPEFTTIATAAAFDEGTNFIQIAFGPITLVDYSQPGPDLGKLFDYHIGALSAGIDGAGAGTGAILNLDFDNDTRPLGPAADIGADELQ